jgi:three-Cys-motif partner protein
VSTGTTGSYWDGPTVQALFKHHLLHRYMAKFGAMTGYRNRRLVYLDGYAGQGRYASGDPGSAELVLRLASYFKEIRGDRWTIFLTERDEASFRALEQVTEGYQARGIDAHALNVRVEDAIDQVIDAAAGLPLFLFLDPCGLGLPFRRLVEILNRRPDDWPPTEVLLNFSMDAVRRLGGVAVKGIGGSTAARRMDEAVGDTWWRKLLHDYGSDEGPSQIAGEFSQRLAREVRMQVESVPVRRKPHHKPIYHLVFGTRSVYGTWVFGDSLARTMPDWWKALDQQERDDADHQLADHGVVQEVIGTRANILRPDVYALIDEAAPVIAENIVGLLRDARVVHVIDHVKEIFGPYYGIVSDDAVSKAVSILSAQRKVKSNNAAKPRKLQVRRT